MSYSLTIRKHKSIWFVTLLYFSGNIILSCGSCRQRHQSTIKEENLKNGDYYVVHFTNVILGEDARKVAFFMSKHALDIRICKKKLRNNMIYDLTDKKFIENEKNAFIETKDVKIFDIKAKFAGDVLYCLFHKNNRSLLCMLCITVYPKAQVYIDSLITDVHQLRKGYAKLLLSYVLQQYPRGTLFELAANGCDAIISPKGLVEFYENFGFKMKTNGYKGKMEFLKESEDICYNGKVVPKLVL